MYFPDIIINRQSKLQRFQFDSSEGDSTGSENPHPALHI